MSQGTHSRAGTGGPAAAGVDTVAANRRMRAFDDADSLWLFDSKDSNPFGSNRERADSLRYKYSSKEVDLDEAVQLPALVGKSSDTILISAPAGGEPGVFFQGKDWVYSLRCWYVCV